MEAVAFISRLLVGAVFVMAAIPKVLDRKAFVQTVMTYGILPVPAARVYGTVVPWLELGAAALLIFGVFTPVAAAIVAALLASFITAVAIAMKRGAGLACGCFGLLYRESVGRATQGRDAILLLLTIPIFTVRDEFSLPQLVQRGERLDTFLFGVVLLVTVGSIWLGLLTVRHPRALASEMSSGLS